MRKVKDPINSIGVGANARGILFFVTYYGALSNGKRIYRGFDIYGSPRSSTCLTPVSWSETVKKLKWRLGP